MPRGNKRKVEQKLLRAGFKEVPGKGGHRKYKHADGRCTQIPFGSKKREIGAGLVSKIARESGLHAEYLTGNESYREERHLRQ